MADTNQWYLIITIVITLVGFAGSVVSLFAADETLSKGTRQALVLTGSIIGLFGNMLSSISGLFWNPKGSQATAVAAPADLTKPLVPKEAGGNVQATPVSGV